MADELDPMAANISDDTGGIDTVAQARPQSKRLSKLWCDQGFKKAFHESCARRGISTETEPEPSSRHLHAGHHLANTQDPARLIPGSPTLVSISSHPFRHFNSGSLAFVFTAHT